MGIQEEETLDKVKMGMDSKENFAQMHKNRNMEDGIRGQMMKLDPPMELQTPQKITNQNSKATLNKGLEQNGLRNLLIRPIMSLC